MSLSSKRTKDLLSSVRIEMYEKNAKIIKYYRRNPVIACRDLLGIELIDSQKYMLTMSWNCPNVLWACS